MDFLADDVFFYLYSIRVGIDLASIRWASDSVAEIDFNWMKYKPHKNESHAEHQSTVLYYCKKYPDNCFQFDFQFENAMPKLYLISRTPPYFI